MMRFPRKEEVEALRRRFPVGARIVLDEMDDPYTKIPEGSQGTVTGVDDAGNILCHWDMGSSLSIAYGADRAHMVANEEEIRESLNWLGERQVAATAGGHCPRCGAVLESFKRHALSRRASVTVCDACGMEEALEDAGLKEKKPLSGWWWVGNWQL